MNACSATSSTLHQAWQQRRDNGGGTILSSGDRLAMVIIPLMAFEALPTPPSMMFFVAHRHRPRAATSAAQASRSETGGSRESERGPDRAAEGNQGGACGHQLRARWRRRRARRCRRCRRRIARGTPASATDAAGSRRRTDQAADEAKHVAPTYPPIAQSARVQGVVIIEAVIGPNGSAGRARPPSIPLLDQGGARCRQAVGVLADPASATHRCLS